MSLTDSEKKKLISHRIKQAHEIINVVELLINNNELATAVNRIYYGMFYSLLALGIKFGFETSKHQQLIGWFNKNFIHTGKIDIKYGRILRNAYEHRMKSDYDAFVQYYMEDIKIMLSELIEFINEIERIISNIQ